MTLWQSKTPVSIHPMHLCNKLTEFIVEIALTGMKCYLADCVLSSRPSNGTFMAETIKRKPLDTFAASYNQLALTHHNSVTDILKKFLSNFIILSKSMWN